MRYLLRSSGHEGIMSMKSLDKTTNLIAPCGMNCSLCLAYQRKNNKCPGCNTSSENKPKYCLVCIIKHCDKLTDTNFCYSCDKYPCSRLKKLYFRYRTKYGMSMLQNLQTIKIYGLEAFIQQEKEKWTCQECGSLLCVHRGKCLTCGWVL